MSTYELLDALAAIGREERLAAYQRQVGAGTGEPVKLLFRQDLPEELEIGCQRLWDAGCNAGGRPHTDLRRLWNQVNKGLSVLSEPDFLEFANFSFRRMQRLAGWIADGHSLAETLWLRGGSDVGPDFSKRTKSRTTSNHNTERREA